MNVKIETLESKSYSQKKYMNCNYSGDVQRDASLVRTESQETPQREPVQYVGFINS